MLNQCFSHGCEFEVQYVCQCSPIDTYSCEFHLADHLRLPNRTHFFGTILEDPPEGTTILDFLEKEKSKIKKLKEIVSTSFRPNLYNSRNSVEEALSKLDSYLEKIVDLIEKISQIPKEEQGLYYSLQTDSDTNGVRDTVLEFSEAYNSLKLWRLWEFRTKKYLTLNRPNNVQIEQEFRRACFEYESSNFWVGQAFQDYANTYHQITSLYLICCKDKKISLFIYDTENETEQVRALELPLNLYPENTLIIQLSSGEFFCISDKMNAYIIDKNYEVGLLSIENNFLVKTAIHFKGSVYCFGKFKGGTNHSIRFEADKNCWFSLAPMPQGDFHICYSVIFNKNILISEYGTKKLMLYSIDIDSFTTVPYDFAIESRKILINEAERVYLIECPGFIYESEAWNVYNWQKISKSIINYNPDQVYWSYNKGGIYIATLDELDRDYYKFDLDQKTLTEVAYYNEHIAIKRTNNKLEAIKCFDQTFKLHTDHAEGYIQKGYTLRDLGYKLEELEQIKLYPHDDRSYLRKGDILADLGRKTKAIKCYSKAIKLNPNNYFCHLRRGITNAELGNYNEAIECYNEAIKLKPDTFELHYNKGALLSELGRNMEAIECFDKVIELVPHNIFFFCYRAWILNELGRETEALKNFNVEYNWIQEITNSEANNGNNVRRKLQYPTDMLLKLLELQDSVVKFKEELQKLKSDFSENLGLLKEIEEKEGVVKEQHSELLKRAVKWLSESNWFELNEQIEKEVVDLQKTLANTISQFRSETFNLNA